jgi:Kdo2-lipid IVA lauroyltransferase/acyltransferase
MTRTGLPEADAPPPLWLRALARLPLGVLYASTAALVFVLRYLARYRVQVARSNLRRCFPGFSSSEIDAVLNDHYRHLAMVAAECLKLAALSREQLVPRVRFTNLELLRAENSAGRSVLLLGAHQANWEWQLQGLVAQLDVPVDAAYKPLHGEAANRALLWLRARFGARLVAAKQLMRAVARHRDEVRVIALMADQIPTSSAGRHWVSFFGGPTAFYPGPAEIARLTGYAAFFASMRRIGRGYYEMTLHPITRAGERLEPEVLTARYAQLLEAHIRSAPSAWLWTHRRWKLQPPAQLESPRAASV